METRRGRHTAQQHKVRGVALVSALVTGIIVALSIGGLYYALIRTTVTAERVKTYTSTSEATVGGINHAISQIRSGVFDTLLTGECPPNAQRDNNCCDYSLSYKLSTGSEIFTNKVRLCLSGYVPPPGEQVKGVARSEQPLAGRGYVYLIVSEVTGPQGSTSRIEAVYVR